MCRIEIYHGQPLNKLWLGLGVNITRIILALIIKVFIILHFFYILTGIDHVFAIPRVI